MCPPLKQQFILGRSLEDATSVSVQVYVYMLPFTIIKLLWISAAMLPIWTMLVHMKVAKDVTIV